MLPCQGRDREFKSRRDRLIFKNPHSHIMLRSALMYIFAQRKENIINETIECNTPSLRINLSELAVSALQEIISVI